MSIPIKLAKKVAFDIECSQVIIIGWDGEQTHLATYGKTIEDCDMVAQAGNHLKKIWNWPESTFVDPSRVAKLKARVKELENQIEAQRYDISGH